MDSFISHFASIFVFTVLLLDVLVQISGGVSYIFFWRRLREVYGIRALTDSREHPASLVSVVIAAYNEEGVIAKTLAALLKNDHPALEIIVVDDGSTDDTFYIVSVVANSSKNVRVLRNTTNMGKCRSIEAGIEFSAGQIICLIDADTIVCREFVSEIIHSIQTGEADATSGNVKVGNKTNMLTHFQSIEYIAILNRIRAFQAINGFVTTMPGAACAFRKSVLASVGGYSSGSVCGNLAEDADFTIRLSLHDARIRFAPGAIAYTEAPSSWKNLFLQRRRWVFGNMQCIFGHVSAWQQRIQKPLYGFPFFSYENIGRPVFEFIRNVAVILFIQFHGLHPLLLILAASFGINAARATAFHVLEKEQLTDLLHLPARFLVWPLFNVLPFAFATLHFLLGQAVAWHKLERSGDATER